MVQTNTDMAMCNIQYVDEHGKAMSKQDFFRDFQIKNNVWTQRTVLELLL
ncbi:MAG: hypothetical protein ACLTRS_06880 [Lachnospiraceae bacterium]